MNPPNVVWVVRHACAGHKEDWEGADDVRPLDPAGLRQADALAPYLLGGQPARLLASTARRCVETLRPLAALSGLTVETDPILSKGRARELPGMLEDPALDRTVVCTHGEVMTPLLAVLRQRNVQLDGDPTEEDLLLKGSAWRITFDNHEVKLSLLAPAPLTTCPHHR